MALCKLGFAPQVDNQGRIARRAEGCELSCGHVPEGRDSKLKGLAAGLSLEDTCSRRQPELRSAPESAFCCVRRRARRTRRERLHAVAVRVAPGLERRALCVVRVGKNVCGNVSGRKSPR